MMTGCKDVKILIDKLMNGKLDDIEKSYVEDHVKKCPICKKNYENTLSLSETLSSYGSTRDQYPDSHLIGLAGKIKSRKQNKKSQGMKISSLFKPAIVAFAFVLIVFGVIYFPEPDKAALPEVIARTNAQSGEPISIELFYHASENVNDVEFTIVLDKEVAFHSTNEKIRGIKHHRWKRSLKKGKNRIPFVVDAKEKGKWHIDTEARFQGYSRRHRIVIKVGENNTEVVYLRYPENELKDVI